MSHLSVVVATALAVFVCLVFCRLSVVYLLYPAVGLLHLLVGPEPEYDKLTGLLIGCDKKLQIMRNFQGRLCD